MNGPQRENQNNLHKLCNCNQFMNNNNVLMNNDLQQNVNPSSANDRNLYMRVGESTSQNTNSIIGMQKRITQLNQNLPLIDLSVEENGKNDSKVIKEEKEEPKNKNGNFNPQCDLKTEVDNKGVTAINKVHNEEIYEIKDLSILTAKKEEVCEAPQVKNETVPENESQFDKIFKFSEINKAAINRIIKNNITQQLQQNSDETDSVKKLIENVTDNMKAKLLNGPILNLLLRSQNEAMKRKMDQCTQTDKNNNDKFSQTETQTNNRNYRTSPGIFNKQLNSYINQNQLKYHMMVQDSTQQVVQNNQRVFLQEGMGPSQVVMGREVARNVEPAMMQAGLPYPYQPSAVYNPNRPAVARHPYTSSHIRARNQSGRNIHQATTQARSQYRQVAMTQNMEWEMANNTNNYQNFHDYQNQFEKF